MSKKGQPPPPSPVGSEEGVQTREDEIFKVVRGVLENTGELQKMKALLQTKVLKIVRGGDSSPIISRIQKDPRTKILDSLIMEYFHWFGYQYSVEMFASESGTSTACPTRNLLKSVGDHEPDIPILVSVVNSLLEENKNNNEQ